MLSYREPTWDLMCVIVYGVKDDSYSIDEDPDQSNLV